MNDRLVRREVGPREMVVTGLPSRPGDVRGLFEAVRRALRDAGASVLGLEVFGVPFAQRRALAEAWGHLRCPVTWVDGRAAGLLAGVIARAVRGVKPRPVAVAGRVVAAVYEDQDARHAYLGGVGLSRRGGIRREQARWAFEAMSAALDQAEMDFTHVVRTWLFLDDILSWYGRLNEVRTEFFRDRGVFDGLVPASTGIGGANAEGAALVAGAYAMRPAGSGVRVQAVPSPLQCPALGYGSSFSRAVEITLPDHRRLLVSGTASIDAHGRTACAGDVDAQIRFTMEVVAAILESRGLHWGDVVRAVAYVKRPDDAGRVRAYVAGQGLDAMPLVLSRNDICRDELLFEIEVDAVTAC